MSFHWMRTRSIMAAVGVSAFLSACGGGGSEPIVASPLPFSIKAAYTTQFNDAKTLTFTMSGTVSGVAVTGSGSLTRSAPTLSTFEGAGALRKVTTFTGSLLVSGRTEPFATTVTEFVDVNGNPMGQTGTGSGEYEVVAGTVSIPLSAKVGDSGVLYTANRYADSSKATLVGTRSYSYTLEAATATTATLKILETDKNAAGSVTETNTVVFDLTASGGVTRKSETSVSGNDTLTVNYAS